MSAVLDPGRDARTSHALQSFLRSLCTAFREQKHDLSGKNISFLLKEAWPDELDDKTANAILVSAFPISNAKLQEVMKTLNRWAYDVGMEGASVDDIRANISIHHPPQGKQRSVTPLKVVATSATKTVTPPSPPSAEKPRLATTPPTVSATTRKAPPAKPANDSGATILPERLDYLLYMYNQSPMAFCALLGLTISSYYNWRSTKHISATGFAAIKMTSAEDLPRMTDAEKKDELRRELTDPEKLTLEKRMTLIGHTNKHAPVKVLTPPPTNTPPADEVPAPVRAALPPIADAITIPAATAASVTATEDVNAVDACNTPPSDNQRIVCHPDRLELARLRNGLSRAGVMALGGAVKNKHYIDHIRGRPIRAIILQKLGVDLETAASPLDADEKADLTARLTKSAAMAEPATTPVAEPQAEASPSEEPKAEEPAPQLSQEVHTSIPNISGLSQLTISHDTLTKLIAWGAGGVILLQARQFIDTLQGSDRDLAYMFLGCEACDGE